MNKTCENCSKYKAQKVFGRDGLCLIVPSKRKFVLKNSTCQFWTEKGAVNGK